VFSSQYPSSLTLNLLILYIWLNCMCSMNVDCGDITMDWWFLNSGTREAKPVGRRRWWYKWCQGLGQQLRYNEAIFQKPLSNPGCLMHIKLELDTDVLANSLRIVNALSFNSLSLASHGCVRSVLKVKHSGIPKVKWVLKF
jgi:hypothetical protein